jgi:hypothetical protein
MHVRLPNIAVGGGGCIIVLYSGCTAFDLVRRSDILTEGFRGFSQLSRQIREYYIEIGHNHFLPHITQFIFHNNPPNQHCISHTSGKAALNKR